VNNQRLRNAEVASSILAPSTNPFRPFCSISRRYRHYRTIAIGVGIWRNLTTADYVTITRVRVVHGRRYDPRLMRSALAVLALLVAACGGSSPSAPSATPTPTPQPTPIAQASLGLAANADLSLPNCDAKRVSSQIIGLQHTTCPSFSFPARNAGPGCATNIHGTISTFSDSALTAGVGVANWTYVGTVKVGESFVTSGTNLEVMTSASTWWRVTFAWDDVRC
jgi:hypothetical protein